MTIPEFVKKVHCSKKQSFLGDCYDTNMVFYSMINPLLTEDTDITIIMDSSKASLGTVKYKLKSSLSEYDFTYIKTIYESMNIDQFGNTFVTSTKFLKDNSLQITITKKINNGKG
jgi:hypothetical protein